MADLSLRDGSIITSFASRFTEQEVRAIEVIVDGAYAVASEIASTMN